MFTSISELRVRFQETDKMGVVYHSNYYVWFEIGRTDYLRELGYPYSKLEEEGIMLPVIECDCKYINPARYDDEIIVKSTLEELKGASMTIYYEVFRKVTNELLVTGHTMHAITDKNMKPVRLRTIKPELWERLNKTDK